MSEPINHQVFIYKDLQKINEDAEWPLFHNTVLSYSAGELSEKDCHEKLLKFINLFPETLSYLFFWLTEENASLSERLDLVVELWGI